MYDAIWENGHHLAVLQLLVFPPFAIELYGISLLGQPLLHYNVFTLCEEHLQQLFLTP
jgi:hypothetical protein